MSEKMSAKQLTELPLWEQFEQEARRHKCDAERLLEQWIQEQLEIWEDQKLDAEIRKQVQKSGYREEDAVEIVRQHRREKQAARVETEAQRATA